MLFVLNVVISALIISTAAWLSRRAPGLAGFMVAMPVATLIVLPLSYLQHGSSEDTVNLARSILVALPITLGFFVPFLLTERLQLSFWTAYGAGVVLLPAGYVLHRLATRWLF
ncbi:MAG: hypothetical protein MJE66_03620 [Proteobacteria bacterium]|nr:hypothetical protein [Pseudomonadota bacterium]